MLKLQGESVYLYDIKCKINETGIKTTICDSVCVREAPLTMLFGTSNLGKLNAMRKHLAGLNVNIIGLNDINIKRVFPLIVFLYI